MYKKLLENQGLTLVELIITVSILGIIISFMYTFFYFNYDTLLRTGTRYEIQSNSNQAMKAVEDELRYADEIYIYMTKRLKAVLIIAKIIFILRIIIF